MDFWSHLFDNDWRQRSDINDLQKRTQRAKTQLFRSQHELRAEVEQLQDQVAGICLFQRTLLSVLTERGLVSPEEFQKKMDQFDAEDGFLDGK